MVRAATQTLDACPCCRRPLEQKGLVFFDDVTGIVFYKGRGVFLSPTQYRVFKIISKAGSIDADALVARMYAHDPEGGPDSAFRVLHGTIHELRLRLRHLGIQVPGKNRSRGGYGAYRVVLG